MALLEGMACSLPLAAFDVPTGPREIIEDGVNGCLVAPGDVAAMAACVSELIEAPARRCAMAAANIWSICFLNSKAGREKARPRLLEMSAFVRERKPSVYQSVSFGLTGRLTLRLVPYPAGWSFLLAYLLGAVSRWKHGSPV